MQTNKICFPFNRICKCWLGSKLFKKQPLNVSYIYILFIAGVTENILLFLQYLLRNRELYLWYGRTDLRLICRFGILVAIVGLLNLGYHTTIQILLKKRKYSVF